MAKKRLKNDQLAKLRQFQKGMNVEDYLQNQHRQVIRALEESYVNTDDIDLSPYAKSADISTPIVSGVHALKTSQQTITGNVAFDSWHCPTSAGTFNGTLFRPSKNGTYWIEAIFIIKVATVANARIDFDIIKEPLSVLNTYSYQANPFNETSISSTDANEPMITTPSRNPIISRHIYSFSNLTTSAGVFFKFSITNTTGALYKIMCKIYRIGD